jgi:hypothetical protein
MLPTGLLHVKANGKGFVWMATFKWKYEFLGISLLTSGDGTATISSEKIEFVQSYLDGMPDTNVYVKWHIDDLKLNGFSAIKAISDWIRSVIIELVYPHLTLKINMHTDKINKNIIKNYEKITIKPGNYTVNVNNRFLEATQAVYKNQEYTVLAYKASIEIENTNINKAVTRLIDTPVETTTNSTFDYQVCYNVQLFGDYLDALIKTQKFAVNMTDPSKYDYPNTIGFYKAILPEVGNRYSDEEKVAIECNADGDKTVIHVNATSALEHKFLLPWKCKFIVLRNKEVFLNVMPMYMTTYKIGLSGAGLWAKISDMKTHTIGTNPIVDRQGIFMLLEITDRIKRVIDGYVMGEPNWFSVQNLRPDEYESQFAVDQRKEDVCLLYKEKI